MKNYFLAQFGKKATTTENGAVSNISSGSHIVDQFAHAGTYRDREIDIVFTEQSYIWDEDPMMALRFPFYLRLITRKIKVNEGFATEKVQNGQGSRDEAFKRLLWIAKYHKDDFYKNVWLLPLVGSWKDLWQMMHYDVEFGTEVLDRGIIFTLLAQGMSMEEHSELIKKFMPRIKANSKCTTSWTKNMNKFAKEFAQFLKWDYSEYNKFKATGTAHEFQKCICGQMYDKINWKAIPGRALNLLIDGKFLENHNLVDAYTAWIESQPLAKYTGYVYELLASIRSNTKYGFYDTTKLPKHKEVTFNKQFDSLVNTAKQNGTLKENIMCALDTSGSMMCSPNPKMNVTALDVCMSLGIFFSELNEGAFHNHVMMFDNESRMLELTGTFCDKVKQIPSNAMGGTNFLSIVKELVRVRQTNPNIPLKDFPTAILVVSDMQFNPVQQRYDHSTRKWVTKETNEEAARAILSEAFPEEWVKELKFIWWNVNSRGTDVPATLDEGGNNIMLSGFDGSIISLLLGEEVTQKEKKEPVTMENAIKIALTQEILEQISLA